MENNTKAAITYFNLADKEVRTLKKILSRELSIADIHFLSSLKHYIIAESLLTEKCGLTLNSINPAEDLNIQHVHSFLHGDFQSKFNKCILKSLVNAMYTGDKDTLCFIAAHTGMPEDHYTKLFLNNLHSSLKSLPQELQELFQVNYIGYSDQWAKAPSLMVKSFLEKEIVTQRTFASKSIFQLCVPEGYNYFDVISHFKQLRDLCTQNDIYMFFGSTNDAIQHNIKAAMRQNQGIELHFSDTFFVEDKYIEDSNYVLPQYLFFFCEKNIQKKLEPFIQENNFVLSEVGKFNNTYEYTVIDQEKNKTSIPIKDISAKLRENILDLSFHQKEEHIQSFNYDKNSIKLPDSFPKTAKKLLLHPRIVSRREVFAQHKIKKSAKIQFDGKNVLQQTDEGFRILTGGLNPSYIRADASLGMTINVAAMAREISCLGGTPEQICINIVPFSQNEKELINSLESFTEGLLISTREINIMRTSATLQLEHPGAKRLKSIPDFEISMTGFIDKAITPVTKSFKKKGDMIYIIGDSKEDISGSLYMRHIQKIKESPAPYFDLESELLLHKTLREIVRKGYITSANSISEGGLYAALFESCIENELGFDITTDSEIRLDSFLFGESQGRAIITVNTDIEADFVDYMMSNEIPLLTLGHVTKGEMRIDDESYGFIEYLKQDFENRIYKFIH